MSPEARGESHQSNETVSEPLSDTQLFSVQLTIGGVKGLAPENTDMVDNRLDLGEEEEEPMEIDAEEIREEDETESLQAKVTRYNKHSVEDVTKEDEDVPDWLEGESELIDEKESYTTYDRNVMEMEVQHDGKVIKVAVANHIEPGAHINRRPLLGVMNLQVDGKSVFSLVERPKDSYDPETDLGPPEYASSREIVVNEGMQEELDTLKGYFEDLLESKYNDEKRHPTSEGLKQKFDAEKRQIETILDAIKYAESQMIESEDVEIEPELDSTPSPQSEPKEKKKEQEEVKRHIEIRRREQKQLSRRIARLEKRLEKLLKKSQEVLDDKNEDLREKFLNRTALLTKELDNARRKEARIAAELNDLT